ncbi:MAG: LysM peptidoglycan-binding domain-containing protein [Acidobacteriota bacterium]
MNTGFKVAVVGTLVVLTVACCRKAPKEVGDASAALNDLQSTCASTYDASGLSEAQNMMSQANDLVANKKCKDAKAKALDVMKKVDEVKKATEEEQAKAKTDAESAISSAKDAIKDAESAKAPEYAASTYQQAQDSLNEAENLMSQSACNYYKAKDAANKAHDLAVKAKSDAEAEVARIKAEEASKRAEAEAALKAHPKTYTVVKGDCLWKISAKDKIYGNPFMWPLIWNANRNLIKNHPDLIYPDWVLKINRDYTDKDAKKADWTARHHHWEPKAPEAPKDVKTAPSEAPAGGGQSGK